MYILKSDFFFKTILLNCFLLLNKHLYTTYNVKSVNEASEKKLIWEYHRKENKNKLFFIYLSNSVTVS